MTEGFGFEQDGPPRRRRAFDRFADRLETAVRWVNRAMLVSAGLALVAIMLLSVLSMAARELGLRLPNFYEVQGYLCALVVAMALGHTQSTQGHVMVDIITNRFPQKFRDRADRFNYLVCAVLFGLIAWRLLERALELQAREAVSGTLKIPYYPVVHLTALGFGVLALTLLADLVLTFRTQAERGPGVGAS